MMWFLWWVIKLCAIAVGVVLGLLIVEWAWRELFGPRT